MVLLLVVFFFKQKTAYEMRISDWSSDVCSSDLKDPHRPFVVQAGAKQITALGTIFEVRLLDSDRMKVTLVEGKVVVDEGEDRPDDGAPVMVPAVLAPGDALVVSADAAPVRFKVDVDQQLRLREGFVEFADATLARSEEQTAAPQSLMRN